MSVSMLADHDSVMLALLPTADRFAGAAGAVLSLCTALAVVAVDSLPETSTAVRR